MIPQLDVHLTWGDCWAVSKCLRSGWIGPGKEVAKLESTVAEMHGAAYGVAVPSGTTALWLAMRVLHDEQRAGPITCPAYTFPAAHNAALVAGLQVQFSDIRWPTLSLNPELLGNQSVVCYVDHNGYMGADRFAVQEHCQRLGGVLIEDACQAFGLTSKIVGRFAALSFSPFKPITSGMGGMVLCNTREDATKVRKLAYHGITDSKAMAIGYGLNLRMSDIHASLLNNQLRRWPKLQSRRVRLHEWYRDGLSGKVPLWSGWCVIVRSVNPERLMARLACLGYGTAQYYDLLSYAPGAFPVAESASRELVYLPSSPRLTKAQVHGISMELLKCDGLL